MSQTTTELLIAVLPWLWLTLGTLVCAVGVRSALVARRSREVAIGASLLSLVSAFAEMYRGRKIASGVFEVAGGGTSHLATGTLIVDYFALIVLIALAVFAVVMLLAGGRSLERLGPRSSLVCALVLASEGFAGLLGAQQEMAMLLLGVGGVTFCATAMISCFKTDHLSVEVAAKWLAGSAFLTATLALGLALLYGAVATTQFTGGGDKVTEAIGAMLVIASLAAFSGALPLPQLFAGAGLVVPPAVAGWVMTFMLTGIGSALVRIGADGLGRNVSGWAGTVGLLGALTVMYAGVQAWREQSLRGLVSYLAVAQSGAVLFALMSFGAGTDGITAGGVDLVVAALIVGGLSITAAFAVVALLENEGMTTLHDYRALVHRNGGLALLLGVAVLALAGAPPTAGFVLRSLSVVTSAYIDRFAIGVLAGAGTAMGILAALRVVGTICAPPSHDSHRLHPKAGLVARAAGFVTCIALVVSGLFSGTLMGVAATAARAIFTH
jgi:NADH-quinone oxidoreductase subunit N